MTSLRQTVAGQMVRIHEISPELAEYHVRQMTPFEVKQRFLFYVRSGLAKTDRSSRKESCCRQS